MSTSSSPSPHAYAGRTFIIDRKTWLRGERDSQLLRVADGKMCCLGQIALQVGYSPESIRGIALPRNLGWSEMTGPQHCGKFMDINDRLDLNEVQREEMLMAQAAQFGFTLEFIN